MSLDTDGNGVLSVAELRAAVTDERAKLIWFAVLLRLLFFLI